MSRKRVISAQGHFGLGSFRILIVSVKFEGFFRPNFKQPSVVRAGWVGVGYGAFGNGFDW